jgi:hypothetical protein
MVYYFVEIFDHVVVEGNKVVDNLSPMGFSSTQNELLVPEALCSKYMEQTPP